MGIGTLAVLHVQPRRRLHHDVDRAAARDGRRPLARGRRGRCLTGRSRGSTARSTPRPRTRTCPPPKRPSSTTRSSTSRPSSSPRHPRSRPARAGSRSRRARSSGGSTGSSPIGRGSPGRTSRSSSPRAGWSTTPGRQLRANSEVRGGGVTLEVPPPEIPYHLEPDPTIEIRVAYEDDDLLIVDKPSGLVVHPSPGHWRGTLVNALLARGDHYGGIAGVARPGIVHRLDRDTSGLLIVARNDAAQASVMAQLKARRVRKTYVALVQGSVAASVGPDRGARSGATRRTASAWRWCPTAGRPSPATASGSGSPAGRCSSWTWSPGGRTRSASTSRRSATRSPATRSTARGPRGGARTASSGCSCTRGGWSSSPRRRRGWCGWRRRCPRSSRRCSRACGRRRRRPAGRSGGAA